MLKKGVFFCRVTISSLVLFALTIILPQIVYAADGEAGHADRGPGLLLYWINFLIFCGIAYFFLRKAIPAGWQKRCDRLEQAVSRGKLELEAASQRLEGAKLRLASAQHEISQMQQNVARDAAEEARLVLADARQKSVEIVAQARDSAQGERKSLEVGIRKELAELVISKVRQRISSEPSVARDSLWRESAIGAVGDII